jgi:phage-related protein
MAKFEFTIPSNIVSGVSNSATVVTADRGLTRNATQRVLVAKFGDGYEQRAVDGINVKDEQINITFNNRAASEINLIAAFFDVNAAKSFDLSISDHTSTNSVIKVVCDTYNLSYPRETIHSLSATLRRVYEP